MQHSSILLRLKLYTSYLKPIENLFRPVQLREHRRTSNNGVTTSSFPESPYPYRRHGGDTASFELDTLPCGARDMMGYITKIANNEVPEKNSKIRAATPARRCQFEIWRHLGVRVGKAFNPPRAKPNRVLG